MLTKINLFEIRIIEKSTKIKLFGEQMKKFTTLDDDDLIMSAIKMVAQYFKEDISKVIYVVKVCFLRFIFTE